MGQDTSCGSFETDVVRAMTGPVFTLLGMVCQPPRARPGHSHGFFMTAAGSALAESMASTRRSVERKMNLVRSKVPKMFAAMGKDVPLTFVNRSAGPPALKTRRWIAPTSRYGSTGASMLTSCLERSRSSRQDLRLR
jgi:hypothetical protein